MLLKKEGLGFFYWDKIPKKPKNLNSRGKNPPISQIKSPAADRRFAIGVQTALPGDRRACRNTRHQSQNIFGSNRVSTFGHIAQNIMHTHCAPAKILPIKSLLWLLNGQ